MPESKVRKLVIKRSAAVLSGPPEEVAIMIEGWLRKGWTLAHTIPWRDALIAIFDTWVPEEDPTP